MTLFCGAVEYFPPDTQVTSNSHKRNPLCCIMFLLTFQECTVVRGVLIRYFSFSLHLSLLFILFSLYHFILNQPLPHFTHTL